MKSTQDKVVFYPSKKVTFRLIGIHLFLTVMFIASIFLREQLDANVVTSIILGFGAIYMLPVTAKRVNLLSSAQPILEMDDIGFRERATWASADWIRWNEVTDVIFKEKGKKEQGKNVMWLMVFVENPGELLHRQKSPITKFFMHLNQIMNKPHANMSVTELSVSHEDFFILFMDYLDLYGKQPD